MDHISIFFNIYKYIFSASPSSPSLSPFLSFLLHCGPICSSDRRVFGGLKPVARSLPLVGA